MQKRTLCLILALTAFAGGATAAAGPQAQADSRAQAVTARSVATDPFPAAEASELGIKPEALEMLRKRLASLVEEQQIVGGELHVIKNRRTVLREAVGWKDRDDEVPLETGAIYCVRSMTKPLVGTAIQMLLDEKKLKLETPVHEILPSFDTEATRAITVEHLLTHTGGFPFTTLTGTLDQYADIEAVAAEAAARGVDFEPGSRFEYSDAGSDTLGAIVARVTGMPAEQFIAERILEPLGMSDSHPLIGGKDAVIARIPSAYSGGTGAWERHWSAEDAPIFPLFLTSQSLYATTTDYARFLTLWMDGGIHDGRTLLSPEAIQRGLTPQHPIAMPRGFAGRDSRYGQQWIVYAPAEPSPRSGALFGHNGSDGTYAWAWPEQDLIVLFFTQSRGTMAGLGLEPVLQTLLIDGKLDDPSLTTRVPDAVELQQSAGLFWDETNAAAYYVIYPSGKRLVMERPGKAQLVFKPTPNPGSWVHEVNAAIRLDFVRDASGAVPSVHMRFGDNSELQQRHKADESLPSVEEVVALVRGHHNMHKLRELGGVRLTGTVDFKSRNTKGPVNTLFDADRQRNEVTFGNAVQMAVTDGDRAWSHNAATGTQELDGVLREQQLLAHPLAQFDDWREHFEQVEVLKRIQRGERSILLVRAVPAEAPGMSFFVDETSGRVFRAESLVQMPGMGMLGVRHDFGDLREVAGMRYPFKTRATYVTPLIGEVHTVLEKAEPVAEIESGAFELPE